MKDKLPVYEPLPTVNDLADAMARKFGSYAYKHLLADILYPCAEVAYSMILQITRSPEQPVYSYCGDCKATLMQHYKYCPGCGAYIHWELHITTDEQEQIKQLIKADRRTQKRA
jgi:hypothetical protein